MRFNLRPWKLDDLNSLVKNADNFNVAKFLTDVFPHPYTTEDGKAFLEFITKITPVNNFAIDIEGEAVGGIGIFLESDIHLKNAEIGYWIAESFWGKGIITEAIKQIVEFGFKTYDINRIFARPFGTNIASHRVLEKAGFTLEGRFEKTLYKNGEYLDELIYAVRR
jgi:ribosomal-protein-alanine N-acetyltransferase